MFSFQDARDPVEVAFTDRHGGTSGGPFASLNLASREGGDDPAAVRSNLTTVLSAFAGGTAPPVVLLRQVHGSTVHLVDSEGEVPTVEGLSPAGPARATDVPSADAAVTARPGVVLMVRAADCVPVLLADPEARVVGVAHAGRVGLVAGVVPRTVEVMRDQGARHLTAWVGPHVCGRCYEVPEQMRADVSARVPAAYSETSWGTPAVDVGAGVVAQLEEAGARVVSAIRCTLEDEDLYSHRRQGAEAGRLGGLVWIRP